MAAQERGADEGTPVDTPQGEGEWNGQNEASRTEEDVSTAVSEVGRGRREEVTCWSVEVVYV